MQISPSFDIGGSWPTDYFYACDETEKLPTASRVLRSLDSRGHHYSLYWNTSSNLAYSYNISIKSLSMPSHHCHFCIHHGFLVEGKVIGQDNIRIAQKGQSASFDLLFDTSDDLSLLNNSLQQRPATPEWAKAWYYHIQKVVHNSKIRHTCR